MCVCNAWVLGAHHGRPLSFESEYAILVAPLNSYTRLICGQLLLPHLITHITLGPGPRILLCFFCLFRVMIHDGSFSSCLLEWDILFTQLAFVLTFLIFVFPSI